jgi:hypothetical protein
MSLLGFFITLVIAWTCSMLAGIYFGGKTERPLPTPCLFIGKFLVWKVARVPCYISLGLIAVLFCGFFFPGTIATICGTILLLTISFLPFQLIDMIKRGSTDTASSKTKVINTSSRLKHGSKLGFYIEEEDWNSLNQLSPQDRQFFEQFRIGGSLYVAPATTVVLQLVDSYGLVKYLVNSEHEKALQRIASSLQQTEGEPLPEVPFVQPHQTKNQLTIPEEKMELDDEEDDDDLEDAWPSEKDFGDSAFKIPDFIPPQPKVAPSPQELKSDEDDDDNELDDISDEDIRKFLAELEAEDNEEEKKY